LAKILLKLALLLMECYFFVDFWTKMHVFFDHILIIFNMNIFVMFIQKSLDSLGFLNDV